MKVGVSQEAIVNLEPLDILLVVVGAVLLHGLLLCWNYGATGLAPQTFPLAVRKAVVIMGSEKTLPVSMAVLSTFPAELGEPGIIAIPCILNHLCQIIVDAYVAAQWADVAEKLVEPEGSGEADAGAHP